MIRRPTRATRTETRFPYTTLFRSLLKTIPVSDRIVFAPKDPRYTVAVFTDVECGFCRKLHSQIDDYNREGIAVQYLAFPRMGLGSADFRSEEHTSELQSLMRISYAASCLKKKIEINTRRHNK